MKALSKEANLHVLSSAGSALFMIISNGLLMLSLGHVGWSQQYCSRLWRTGLSVQVAFSFVTKILWSDDGGYRCAAIGMVWRQYVRTRWFMVDDDTAGAGSRHQLTSAWWQGTLVNSRYQCSAGLSLLAKQLVVGKTKIASGRHWYPASPDVDKSGGVKVAGWRFQVS